MLRMLVVDDIDIIRLKIAMQVNESNDFIMVTGTAENGADAAKWLQSNYADICITDIKMPMLDGLELIRMVGEKYPWMVCIIISSYDDFIYAKKSIQLNAIDYILKPVDQSQLEEGLQKAIDKLKQTRTACAESIFLDHRGQMDKRVNEWIEMLKYENDISEDIIHETVSWIADFTDQKYYLLTFLVNKWINAVAVGLNAHPHVFCFQKKSGETVSLRYEDARLAFIDEGKAALRQGLASILRQTESRKGIYQRRVINKLKEFIQENYTRSDFSLQEMADYALISKSYMSNLFKNETGITIWTYIIELRMNKAKELLSSLDTKNFEVASRVGYTDYIHFSKLFKEFHGISPQEFRKKSGGL